MTETTNTYRAPINLATLFLTIVMATIIMYAASAALTAKPAEAHARCDKKDHTHWHWSGGHTDYWKADLMSTKVVVNNGPDYYAVKAYNKTHGYAVATNKCYW